MLGWIALSLLTYLLVLPLLIISKRADRRSSGMLRGLADAPPAGVPSPQRIGYSSVVLERLAGHARTVLGVEKAWMAIREPDGELACVAAAGLDSDAVGTRTPPGRFARPVPAHSSPVTVGGRELGFVCLGPTVDRRELDPGDRKLLVEVASYTAEVLVHHERRLLAAGDSRAEIRAMVGALAEAGGGTYRHSLEVAATARAVGERLGLRGVDLVEVELAALLHDIGKLRLPPHILDKAGPLDADERRLVELHPEWGAELVAGIPGLEAVALLVRLHHERPDGRGYPHGLGADRLPVASRIVSACDAYGAMTRGRNYREPLEVEAALEELELGAGTQFDPDVVEVLASYVREPVALAA